jgi:hypothetical protein
MFTLSTVEKNGGANREFHPQGIASPPEDKIHPWGTTLPLGSKFAPRGKVENGPLVASGKRVNFQFGAFDFLPPSYSFEQTL